MLSWFLLLRRVGSIPVNVSLPLLSEFLANLVHFLKRPDAVIVAGIPLGLRDLARTQPSFQRRLGDAEHLGNFGGRQPLRILQLGHRLPGLAKHFLDIMFELMMTPS
jgi:hypothetical protein